MFEKLNDREIQTCPKCNGKLDQDFHDNVFGLIYGPVGCFNCGWTNILEYDRIIEIVDDYENL